MIRPAKYQAITDKDNVGKVYLILGIWKLSMGIWKYLKYTQKSSSAHVRILAAQHNFDFQKKEVTNQLVNQKPSYLSDLR